MQRELAFFSFLKTTPGSHFKSFYDESSTESLRNVTKHWFSAISSALDTANYHVSIPNRFCWDQLQFQTYVLSSPK
jgi:hypothetical protein